MEYPHELLLKEAGITTDKLGEPLQVVIKDFNDRKRLTKKPETVDKLTALSSVISQNILDYYIKKDSPVIGVDPSNETISSAAEELSEAVEAAQEPAKEEAEQNTTIADNQDTPNIVEPATDNNAEADNNSAGQTAEESAQDGDSQVALEESINTDQSQDSAQEDTETSSLEEQEQGDHQLQENKEDANKDDSRPDTQSQSAEMQEPQSLDLNKESKPKDEYVPSGKDESIIHDLWLKGFRKGITKAQLKAAGLNTGIFGKLDYYGATYGRYRLSATRGGSEIYNLSIKDR